MKRELADLTRLENCCPGHDVYPTGTYSSNRSKRARSRDIKIEHRYVRRVKEQMLIKEVKNEVL